MSIQSIQRAFDILQVIDTQETPLRAAEIALRANLPRTTVIRMLDTLEKVGAIHRLTESNTFHIGPMLRQLGQPTSSQPTLKEIARPYLQQLADQTGETVYLCTPTADFQAHYLDQINSPHEIMLRDWIGKTLPLHATAPGKVFLAHLPSEPLNRFLATPLERFTEKTVTDPAQIRAYIPRIRGEGHAWTHEQTALSLIGVAAPIFDQNNKVIAAVSLGGPAFRFPPENGAQRMAELVMHTAHHIAINLTSHPPDPHNL